jgi:hypothetical protein
MSSILRRYTPPTCTLEVMAKRSVLSRWSDRPVLNEVTFRLSFDDPQRPNDQRRTIQGDRTQLEALAEVVATYIQTQLSYTMDGFPVAQVQPAVEPPLPPRAPAAAPSVPPAVALASVQEAMPQFREASPPPPPKPALALLPQGMLSHRLVLGDLASDEAAATVTLSTLQLFDLANVLDDYTTEFITLPKLNATKGRFLQQGWVRAAAVLVFAVGATVSVSRFVQFSSPVAETASDNAPAASAPSLAPNEGDSGTEERGDRRNANREGDRNNSDSATTRKPEDDEDLFNSLDNGDGADDSSGRESDRSPSTPRAPGVRDPQSQNDQTDDTTNQAPSAPFQASVPDLMPAAPTARSASPSLNGSGAAPSTSTANGAIADESLADPLAAGAPSEPSAEALFDVIPQVAEVRAYFEQQWQPSADQTQTLEYRLSLNSNGTVQSLTPLGESARLAIGQLPLPTSDMAIATPTANGQPARIRVVLSPDGRVRTFLESP